MGCVASTPLMSGVMTKEWLDGQLVQMEGMLSLPVMESRHVVRLDGIGWLFRAGQPRDPDAKELVQNRFPGGLEGFVEFIQSLNEAHVECMVGESIMFPPSDIPRRRMKGQNAIASVCGEFNAKNLGNVSVEFEARAPQTNVVGVRGTTMASSHRHRTHMSTTTVHTQETKLYVIFDNIPIATKIIE